MVFDPEILLIATVIATFAIAVFAAVISWSQRASAPSRATLALFFVAFAFSELDTVALVLTQEMPQLVRDGVAFTSFIANFCLMPLFLVFVRELTDLRGDCVCERACDRACDCACDRGGSLACHFVLPGLALVFSAIAMTLPDAAREIWYSDLRADRPLPGLGFLHYGFTLLTITLVLQWALYAIWILRTQAQHTARLKQHFASTEGMELRWVAVLAAAIGSYIVQTLAGEILILAGGQDPIGPRLDSFLVLIVVSALALWGLRPSPELEIATKALGAVADLPGKKYEKSALGADQSDRIARKLVRAMQEDRLYRDPSLTLSMLSRHVGVSLNYVSQTLNENLGQSFFEFVNGWRVKEASPLVEAGETTVLAIAYEVGFNSRSSFYAAFKRSTGMTPTAYKAAKQSARQRSLRGALSKEQT